MKKLFLSILMVSLVVFCAYSQTGTIRELSGEVELRPAGAAAFTPAQVGSIVAQDTVVSTGFRGTATIAIGSSVITVRPLTRLSLAEIQSSENAETLNVNLQTGRVRVEVKPPSGTRATTTVQTPSATASVRGTTFDMDTVSVDVLEGRVTIQGSDGLVMPVASGQSSEITIGGGAADPISIIAKSTMPSAPEGAGLSGEDVGSDTSLTGSFDVHPCWGNGCCPPNS